MEINFSLDLSLLMRLFGFLIALDFLTGILAAARDGRLRSRTCSNGLFRSMGEIVVLGVFVLLNEMIPNVHDYLEMFMLGFILKELLSVCENLIKLDVWLPQPIIKLLSVGVDKIDSGKLKIKSKK